VGQVSDPYDQGEGELGITISGLPGEMFDDDPEAVAGRDPGGDPGSDVADRPRDADASDDAPDDDETVVFDLDDWSELERQAVADRLREAQIACGWDGTSLLVSPIDEAAVENVLDIVEGESGPALDSERDQVAYDLSEWDDDLLDTLTDELRTAGIAHGWDGDELFVHAEDEQAVDELLDRVEHPNELEPEPDDGPAGAELLGEIFVAADRLRHDAEDPDGIIALIELDEAIEGSDPPYGLAASDWAHLCERVDALAELLQADKVDADAVMTSARDLRTALRPYV
jgi:hypothetical protein